MWVAVCPLLVTFDLLPKVWQIWTYVHKSRQLCGESSCFPGEGKEEPSLYHGPPAWRRALLTASEAGKTLTSACLQGSQPWDARWWEARFRGRAVNVSLKMAPACGLGGERRACAGAPSSCCSWPGPGSAGRAWLCWSCARPPSGLPNCTETHC